MRCKGPINLRVYEELVRLRKAAHDTSHVRRLAREAPIPWSANCLPPRGHRRVRRPLFLPANIEFGAVILGNLEGAWHITSILFKELMDEVHSVPKPERPYLRAFTSAAKLSEPKTQPRMSKKEKFIPSGVKREVIYDRYSGQNRANKREKYQETHKDSQQPRKAPLSM